jgi:type I restriction enzyme R subunit
MPRNEKQTREELINPTLELRGWKKDYIKVEQTSGRFEVVDGQSRRIDKRVDYVLQIPIVPEGKTKPILFPIALIEAKKEEELPAFGLQQARDYNTRFHLPFVFSTNGHRFVEYADDTQETSKDKPLTEFPTPHDLLKRYEAYKTFSFRDKNAQVLLTEYYAEQKPRYYQDAAIRAVFEAIAAGRVRALLSLATGTGKTVIAMQILYRLHKAGLLRKALFLCDRDELRSQAHNKIFQAFGADAQIVDTAHPQNNARVLVASYQTLYAGAQDGTAFHQEHYAEGEFSHIIIDECHRSAYGEWRGILERNPNAIHIGLTATPRQLIQPRTATTITVQDDDTRITADNIRYFGEPVYHYSFGNGMADGYLAACEVERRSVNLDANPLERSELVSRIVVIPQTGEIADESLMSEQHDPKRYEEKLFIQDRIEVMCQDLFDSMLISNLGEQGIHQKTVIFCASDDHAHHVSVVMNRLYEKWCKKTNTTQCEAFAFQCTANPNLRPPASELVKVFRSSEHSHFIATTVDLLSTGVDIPNLLNVVFFRYISSPIVFYQMLGRGTRTGDPEGTKPLFCLYDYTNATRLFNEEFTTRERRNPSRNGGGGEPLPPRPPHLLVVENQFDVTIAKQDRSIIVHDDNKEVILTLTEYRTRLAQEILTTAAEEDDFRSIWIDADKRLEFIEHLYGGENSLRSLQKAEELDDCELFDVLANIAYNTEPKTRNQRATTFSRANKDWFAGFPQQTVGALKGLARQFENGGIQAIEQQTVFETDDLRIYGGREAFRNLSISPKELLTETKRRLLM